MTSELFGFKNGTDSKGLPAFKFNHVQYATIYSSKGHET